MSLRLRGVAARGHGGPDSILTPRRGQIVDQSICNRLTFGEESIDEALQGTSGGVFYCGQFSMYSSGLAR